MLFCTLSSLPIVQLPLKHVGPSLFIGCLQGGLSEVEPILNERSVNSISVDMYTWQQSMMHMYSMGKSHYLYGACWFAPIKYVYIICNLLSL